MSQSSKRPIKYRHLIIDVSKDGKVSGRVSGDNIPARIRFTMSTDGSIYMRMAKVGDSSIKKVHLAKSMITSVKYSGLSTFS